MAWQVQVDFQGGAGWEDITSSVVMPSFVRRRQLWNKLRPTVNTLDFKLKTESSTLIAKLMTAADDILITVTKDGAAYFTGMVQPNYSVTVGGRIGPFDVSCVDNGYRIQRRIIANINWTNYKVCDPSATASSILHQLMVAAGLTTSAVYSSIVTINKTIDRFVGIAGESNVWDMVSDLLYEFGYTFYFRPDGTLNVHYFAPTSITSTGTFSSDTSRNIIGALKVERSQQDYEAVRVKWATHKTLTDVLLFSETSGGDATKKCNLEISSAAYWPTDSNLRDIYADYRVEGFGDVVATSAVVLNIEKDAAVVQDTFTDEVLRAKIKFHNSGATSAYIRRFDITGDAIVKDQYNIQVRVMVSGTNKYLDIDSRYIYSSADADLLADSVAQYYYNADMRYTLRSRSEFEPGAYVDVEETGFLDIDNQCIVQEVSDNEWTGEHTYVLEGVAAYSAGSVSSTGGTVIPFPTPRPNVYTVAADGYTGFADVYCDGTDDHTDINAAIDTVAAAGGGIVQLTEGMYYLGGSVTLDQDDIHLRGVGDATVIEKNGNYVGLYVTADRVTVSELKVTRNGADTNDTALILVGASDGTLITRCTMYDAYFYGVEVGSGSTNTEVRGCAFYQAQNTCVAVLDGGPTLISENRMSLGDITMVSGETSWAGVYIGVENTTVSNNDIGTVASSSSDIKYFYGVDVYNVYGVAISGNTIHDLSSLEPSSTSANGECMGVRIYGGKGASVTNNIITNVLLGNKWQNASKLAGAGVFVYGSHRDAFVDGNTITGCSGCAIYVLATNSIVSNNKCSDNGRNLLDVSDCELSTPPAPFGETTNTLTNCTFARDAAQAKTKTYSYKLTKTIAAGSFCGARLQENVNTTDLHGLLPGHEYTFSAWVYIPSASGILGTEVVLAIYDYTSGAWSSTVQAGANTYDEWQQITVTATIPAAATGALIHVGANSSAAINEYFYVDDVELYDTNLIQNEYLNTEFYNSGANVQQSGNSWNTPYPEVATPELNWGELHEQQETLVDTDPTSTSNQTVTCSSVPEGTRGICGYVRVLSATTAGRAVSIKDAAANTWAVVRNPTTAIYGYTFFTVPLDSSKQFKYAADNTDVSSITIYKRGYYL